MAYRVLIHNSKGVEVSVGWYDRRRRRAVLRNHIGYRDYPGSRLLLDQSASEVLGVVVGRGPCHVAFYTSEALGTVHVCQKDEKHVLVDQPVFGLDPDQRLRLARSLTYSGQQVTTSPSDCAQPDV